MPTLKAIRQQNMRELDLGIIIANADFDSAATTSITSRALRGASWQSNHFEDWYIFRPDSATAAGADNIRVAGTLAPATGVLTTGTGERTYADTTVTSEVVELWNYGIRPDLEWLDALNRAHSFCYFDNIVPLTLPSDGDMQSTATSSYTASNSSLSKVTTAGNVFEGIRALRVANSSANGYAQSGTIQVPAGSNVYCAAIARADVGTANLIVYDVTNSAAIATIESDEEYPHLLWWRGAVPSTCEELAVRLAGEEASADIYWSALWIQRIDDQLMYLPSTADENYKTAEVIRVDFGSGLGTGKRRAFDLRMESVHPSEYNLFNSQPAANPYSIFFNNIGESNYLHYIRLRRPYSDLLTFSAESDTTTCPMKLIQPRLKMEVLQTILIPRYRDNKLWRDLLGQANVEWARANEARPIERVAKRSQYSTAVLLN